MRWMVGDPTDSKKSFITKWYRDCKYNHYHNEFLIVMHFEKSHEIVYYNDIITFIDPLTQVGVFKWKIPID
jgi:hypothetical protein